MHELDTLAAFIAPITSAGTRHVRSAAASRHAGRNGDHSYGTRSRGRVHSVTPRNSSQRRLTALGNGRYVLEGDLTFVAVVSLQTTMPTSRPRTTHVISQRPRSRGSIEKPLFDLIA